jgi:stage III sporulation protein AA
MKNTKEILDILPVHIRNIVEGIKNLEDLQELRLKIDKPLIVHAGKNELITGYTVNAQDLKLIIQHISKYSIYAYEEEIKQGYITIKGGHRIGLCGSCVIENNKIKTIKAIASINVRTCKEIKGCSNNLMKHILINNDVMNTIIISPPRCGKTTLIRDMARIISDGSDRYNLTGKKVCIIDERSEISGCYNGIPQMDIGLRTDVLDNCPKGEGIMMAIRSMSPEVVVCDEIGTYKDIESIIMALNSGVRLITTIHGFGVEDLYKRKVFDEIIENHVFHRAVVLSTRDGAGTIEYIYDFEKAEKLWRR